MRIRELERHEWTLYRDLRLRALAESPDSFGRRFVDEQAQPDAHWIRLTESVTIPGGQVMLVAEEEGRPLGLAFGIFDKERPKIGHVGGMWVDPAARGLGAGQALLDSAIAWARVRDLERLELWVTEGNGAALRLYEGFGFVDTGRREVLPSNPALQIIQMALNL
jgi:ribosomal protein S18 acetylase RimI-like enzyme